MRNDERLRTIYEVMAPYIVRNEHNWRDYLAFASQFHKHSFDNILLVYAQDEDVSILATRKQWAAIGRNLIPRAKGVAVCVYRNAKLTLDYLFDVSQTTGKEIHPTDWQLSDEMKKALTERLSYAHGFPKQDFPQALYAMASESVAENYNHFLQELKQETKGHLFTEIPAGGFEAQYIQLLTDSISYFIGKKCHLPDEEIQLSDGMATVSHFNTLPLVAHLGTAVTALSKGILLEVERNIKIINRERMAQHEQTEYQSEIQGAGRDDASRSANLQQQRSRSTSGQVRPDGPGIPQRESPGAIYDFENGWQSDGDHAPGTGRGDREDRSPDAANAPAGAASADRGHHGADATPEQSETDGGGNRTPERSPDSPLTEEQPNTEVAPSAAPVGEPSEKDGSFSVPAEQPTRHFTDAEVRRNYEYILTSTNLYPPELHSAVRSVLSEPPLNPDWSDKGRQIAALFTPYGDREYQGDLLYRTRLHGEDGISFFFDEGYTYIPWNGLAFLLDAMIEDGDYPNPVVEEQPDPIGDYNIPDEVDEMGGPHRQMTIGEADFDYVLDSVAYEAGETVVEPVKPPAIVQMENDTPAAGDEPASVPDENPHAIVEAPETALPTDTAEQPAPPPVKGNTTAHKNFRRFQELFPEIVSGQYEYLRLEAGEAYYPLVIHHKYGSHYCMLERQINDIENAIYEIKSENGENWSVKQMVIFRKNLDERLKKLSAEEKKDDLLTFEQLGVDMMMVDEAHFFKNCFVFTKLRNVAGITTSSSQRAFDMLLKCQYLQETNQGRGVVFATGTPISNSISELFVMQRYLQPQELERFGWSYFDTWIAHFAKRTSVLELKPEGGGYRMRDRFVRFYNLPELMAVFREVADIKTADMLDIPGLPAVRTGKAEIVSVEATPAQQAIMADFIMRAEAIRTGRVKPEEDNMLKLTGEARLMAIDPRLIRPDADGTGSKLSVCIEDVYQVWKDTAASASTQLVFCDVGTPKAGKFNVYNEIRNVLLAKGVPESEIAFVHDATSEAQRQELFERTRQGKVRILIGSTSKLGTGVNVQNKVISIDHLDCPWKPSDITQRNGRGVRQGNENPEIMIKQFVAKGTFDAYLWQIQEQKLRYITQILTGKHIARSCEDVDETVLSAAQFKAAATDNPMVAQKMELENRVTELKILRGAWSNEQLSLERKISTIYPGQIKRYEKEIDQIGEDIKLLNQSAGSDFSIVLDGKRYTERSEAGEAFGLLYRMIKEGAKDDSEEFEIGAYRSFPLYLSVGYVSRLVLRYNHHYTTEVGTSALGAITRIEHLAERIPGY